jgi:hypothetical protein
VFIGYNNLHKGFKCLDPSEGRVYISHDVVFDENVFPFARLHPNVGMRLRAELALLPDILKNSSAPSSSDFGNATVRDHWLILCLLTLCRDMHLLLFLQVQVRWQMRKARQKMVLKIVIFFVAIGIA